MGRQTFPSLGKGREACAFPHTFCPNRLQERHLLCINLVCQSSAGLLARRTPQRYGQLCLSETAGVIKMIRASEDKDVSYINIGARNQDTETLKSIVKPRLSQQEDEILTQFKLEEPPDHHDEGDDEDESLEVKGQLSSPATSKGWCGVQSYKGWGLRPKWIEIENQKDFPVIVLVCLRKKVSQLQEIAPKMGLTAAPPGGGLTVEAAIKLLLYDGRVNSWIINGQTKERFPILSRKGVYIKVFCSRNLNYTLGRREADSGDTFIIHERDTWMLQTDLEKLELCA